MIKLVLNLERNCSILDMELLINGGFCQYSNSPYRLKLMKMKMNHLLKYPNIKIKKTKCG